MRLAGFLVDVEDGDLDAGLGQRFRAGAAEAGGAAGDDRGQPASNFMPALPSISRWQRFIAARRRYRKRALHGMTAGMASFLMALVAVFAVSLGGRDQLLVARLADRLGRGRGLLAVGVASSAISAFAMAFAGLAMALVLPEPAAHMLVAIALLVAAGELAWKHKAALPKEPTRSLFATFVVLLARQLGDAARFLVFAFAAGGSAWLAGGGGALGGTAGAGARRRARRRVAKARASACDPSRAGGAAGGGGGLRRTVGARNYRLI